MRRPPSRRAALALQTAAWLLLAASAMGAVGAWRLRCENFGCMGLGVVWFAWSVGLFVPTLAVAGWACWRLPAARALRWATAAHGLVGIALAAWAVFGSA